MELTLAQIHDFAIHQDIYDKAEALVEAKQITSLEVDDFSNEEIILVHAMIQDDHKYYEVNLSLDKEDFLVRAHMCTCNANQGIPCPHTTAVLLQLYHNQEKQHKTTTKELSKIKDPAVYQLVHRYEDAIVYASLALNLKQAMQLEPVLEIRFHHVLALTLKIGEKKKYIIKDIDHFLDDMQNNIRRRYGRDLEFLHHRNSFDEASQKLLDFCFAHRNDNLYFQHTYRYRNCPQPRNICLTPLALDQFFEMYQSSQIYYRIKEKTLTNIQFHDGIPPFSICVKKQEPYYHITLNDVQYRIFEGISHIYILHRHILYRCPRTYSEKTKTFLEVMEQKTEPLLIHEDHMRDFYNNVILSVSFAIPLTGDDITSFAPLPLVCKLYLDMPDPSRISAKLIYAYGDSEYNAFANDGIQASRNFNEEIAVRLLLTRYMTKIDPIQQVAYIEYSQDAMYEFLQEGLSKLHHVCEIYASESMRHVEIKDSFKISMGVRIESNLLDIQFDTFDFPIDELLDVLKAYRLQKKYYRMKNGSFVNLEDSSLSELSHILQEMQIHKEDIQQGSCKVDLYRSLHLHTLLKNSQQIHIDRSQSFQEIVRSITNFKEEDHKIPDTMKEVLRNYQKHGFRWLKTMSSYGFSGILADDMGIGKTLQVIALLQDEKDHGSQGTSLVVCPSSLLLNWQNEIEKFSGSLCSLIIAGNASQRMEAIAQAKQYDVVITSYDYLKRDIDLYENHTFIYQILDEAQYIKNHTTKNAQSVKQIHAAHRFALTGTPIENSLAELWSIFDFLMPGYLYHYAYFKNVYETAIIKDHDQKAMQELKRMVEPFILRRVKKEVLKELPEKVENTLFVELDEKERKLYMANVASIKHDLHDVFQKEKASNSIMILSMLTRLRQICCDPRLVYENYEGPLAKMEACMELIENSMAANKKILLFSQFTSLLTLIEQQLQQRDIPYYLLKGSTPKLQRQQLVNAFNTNDIPIFLISLKAGGTGLNLTSAEVVIHFDPWWNVSAQNQATDRAYRIGQHNNVQVFKLITKDTIEERILELQEKKKAMGDTMITQSDGIITHMTQQEILDLF